MRRIFLFSNQNIIYEKSKHLVLFSFSTRITTTKLVSIVFLNRHDTNNNIKIYIHSWSSLKVCFFFYHCVAKYEMKWKKKFVMPEVVLLLLLLIRFSDDG